MRIRSIVTIALLVPVALSAQRQGANGRIGGRASGPTEMPPTAPVVAREMSYVPRPYSAESYTFISYMQQPAAASNALGNYGTLGFGTRLDYRLGQHFSITGDVTQSLFLGTSSTGSVELGMRVRPVALASEGRTHSYLDARFGYIHSYDSYMTSSNPTIVNPTLIQRSRFGLGVGGTAGVGTDFAMTRSISLTTGLWGTRSKLRAYQSTQFSPRSPTSQNYWVTNYRLALGVKWNPMRAVPIDDYQR